MATFVYENLYINLNETTLSLLNHNVYTRVHRRYCFLQWNSHFCVQRMHLPVCSSHVCNVYLKGYSSLVNVIYMYSIVADIVQRQVTDVPVLALACLLHFSAFGFPALRCHDIGATVNPLTLEDRNWSPVVSTACLTPNIMYSK